MMGDIQILTASEPERWREALERVGRFDFYHLPQMHRLAEMEGEGRAVMLVYRESDCTIAFPMLLREIPVAQGAGLCDATSVYGYAGPMASRGVSDEVRSRFIGALGEYYRSESVVSAFSRLHPLMDQQSVLAGCGSIGPVGATVSIDLTEPADAQRSHFRKSHRYEISRLRAMGFECREVGVERLDEFVEIYHASMRDLGADPYYFFSRSYFEYLMREMPGVMHLLVCEQNGVTACAALFAACGRIAQYHLAGTAAPFRRLAPMKLLIDAAREWATGFGAEVLHLGGGVGARRDSLFAFKQGFTDREHTFSVWKHIVDMTVYRELWQDMVRRTGRNPEEGFFPIYRHPEFRGSSEDRHLVLTHQEESR